MAQTQTATVNVRVDANVKRNVEILFDNMGMNISTAVNMFFKHCLMENALPFQPRVSKEYTLKEILREAQEKAKMNGTADMPLDEINAIISEVRQEMRGKN